MKVSCVGTHLHKFVLQLQEFIEHSIAKLYDSVPFDQNNNNDQIYTLKKVLTLTWACLLEIGSCVDDALSAFETLRDGGRYIKLIRRLNLHFLR